MSMPIRILSVDTPLDSAKQIAAAIEATDSRFTVRASARPEHALDQLSSAEIDCIVSAYELAEMDGLAFLEAVRNKYSDIPFILFPAAGSERVASEAIAADVTAYLPNRSDIDQSEELADRIRSHALETPRICDRRRLLDAIETAQEGISILDADGHFLYVNEAYADLYGYEPERLRTEHWELLYPESDVDTITDEILPTVERTGYWRGETRGLRADESTVIVDHTLSMTDDGTLICTVRDVTEKREHERELELTTRAIDAAPMGVVITDPSQPDNPIIYANEQFETITGYPEREVLGRNCRFLQGEKTRDDAVSEIREAIETEEPVSVELRNYRKDGSEFWNQVSITPVRNEASEVINYVGFQQDVTERKTYEQELELFREAVEQAGHGVVITDREGTITYVNPAYERDTGFTRQEAVGLNPRIIKSGKHDESFYEQLWDTILSGDVWEADLINRRKSGELYRVDQTIAPITRETGEISHFVGIESDITDRWLREQRLDVLNRILRHNLRNGMNVIKGNASLLDTALQDGELHSHVRSIQKRADELITLGEKAATGRSLFDSEVSADTGYDIVPLVSNVEAAFERAYPDASISVTVPDAPVEVKADSRLEVAIREAVDNAIVHHDRPVPEVWLRVTVPDNHRSWVEIVIEDTGPTIPEVERKAVKIGEETATVHGSGIGLWLIHWVVAYFGGEVQIEENEPRGNVVTLRLPMADSPGTR